MKQTKLYNKIVEFKPIIEANNQLVAKLGACFDYALSVPKREVPDEITLDGGISRHIFKGLPIIVGSQTNENILIKLAQINSDLFHPYGFFKESLGDKDCLPKLYSEIARLEESEDPSLLGIILDYKTEMAGLLMTDYSRNGEIKIKSLNHGELIEIYDGKKCIKTVAGDLKRGRINLDGMKYLNPEARVEIRRK